MRLEKSYLNTVTGDVTVQTPIYQFHSKHHAGLWRESKLDAFASWSHSRFGIGGTVGVQYSQDGTCLGTVYAVQTRRRSGRFAKTRLGAVLAFLFKAKHEI